MSKVYIVEHKIASWNLHRVKQMLQSMWATYYTFQLFIMFSPVNWVDCLTWCVNWKKWFTSFLHRKWLWKCWLCDKKIWWARRHHSPYVCFTFFFLHHMSGPNFVLLQKLNFFSELAKLLTELIWIISQVKTFW